MYLQVKQELEKHHQKKKYLTFTLGFFGLKNNNPNFPKGQRLLLGKERNKNKENEPIFKKWRKYSFQW